MKEQIKLLRLILDIFEGLSEDQLRDLLDKKAKIKIEYPKPQDCQLKFGVLHDEVFVKLDSLTSRDDATEYFKGLNLTKASLKEIADHYSIPLGSKDTNTQIVEKIIENVIGSKLRFDALLNTNLNK
ncbi:MAG: hypothetical protein PHR92_01435 [Lachnospiraceae bacterium]|nr:hypothetical protein [Lachnospiraceae bacterium]